jgi:hypothetical protein
MIKGETEDDGESEKERSGWREKLKSSTSSSRKEGNRESDRALVT